MNRRRCTAPRLPRSSALRRIHRAVSDLRRGVPVLLSDGETRLALLAAEAASPQGIAELTALAAEPPVVLLAPTRGAAVLRRPIEHGAEAVALRLPDHVLEPEALRRIADPTLAQPRSRPPAGAGAGAAPGGRRACAGEAGTAAARGARRPRARRRAARRRGRWAARRVRYRRSDLSGRGRVRPAPRRRCPGAAAGCTGCSRRRVPQRRLRPGAPCDPGRRAGPSRGAAGAHPFRMLHRRSAGQPALRLRPATARGDPPHGRGRRRRTALSGAGGPRHRPGQQAARLRVAGPRAGHAGRQPRAGLGCRRAQFPDRRAHAGGVGHRIASAC